MKAVKNFLSYVEISTKIASVLPFLVGTGYTVFRYGSLKPKQTLIFFVAMLLFDMTTTAINNHVGHRQTGRQPHYSCLASLMIIFAMGVSAAVLGVYLASISSVVILLAGILCFGMGVIYSYGFLPIARTPFGELFSGATMGVFIPFIAVELNYPMIDISLPDFGRLVITADWLELICFGIIIVPLICCIANIMLANNICDVEEDVRVKRYTLPFYIGVGKALLVYKLLYIATYLFIAVGAILRIIPLFTLAVLLTAIPVKRNVARFMELQDKRQTFFTVIQNFLTITVPYAACIWIGCFL